MSALRIETVHGPMPYGGDLLLQNGIRGINCGCGSSLAAGCLNVDQMSFSDRQGASSEPGKLMRIHVGQQVLYYMQHDLTRVFPFAGQSFSWGYSEHFIEHVALKDAINWLRELRRLIVPGGLLRVTTPDLKKYMDGYADPEQRFFNLHRKELEKIEIDKAWVTQRRAWMVNQIFQYYGHQWLYDFDELVHAASAAGFDSGAIRQKQFQSGALKDVFMLDSASRADETLYVEMEA